MVAIDCRGIVSGDGRGWAGLGWAGRGRWVEERIETVETAIEGKGKGRRLAAPAPAALDFLGAQQKQ
jgi:hypothetical protein